MKKILITSLLAILLSFSANAGSDGEKNLSKKDPNIDESDEYLDIKYVIIQTKPKIIPNKKFIEKSKIGRASCRERV